MLKLSREAYAAIVEEDIAWILRQPRTLERDHVVAVLRASIDLEYPNSSARCSGGVEVLIVARSAFERMTERFRLYARTCVEQAAELRANPPDPLPSDYEPPELLDVRAEVWEGAAVDAEATLAALVAGRPRGAEPGRRKGEPAGERAPRAAPRRAGARTAPRNRAAPPPEVPSPGPIEEPLRGDVIRPIEADSFSSPGPRPCHHSNPCGCPSLPAL